MMISMKNIIKKVVPCEFKKSRYECSVRGLSDVPLKCEECESYRMKLPPKPGLALRPSDYVIITSKMV
jgi:uroporphyrinogen-III synthase